ncbi:MAG: hypothetical protein HY446_00395 [Candidatus Niyogibacteria bacterium]|nr:hypothetical protein [Candidatus Niyogibacteria bacterium]
MIGKLKERRCAFKGCWTILNSYNPGDTCYFHSRPEFAKKFHPSHEKVRNVFVRGKASEDFRSEIEKLDEEFLEALEGLPKPKRILRIVAKAYGIEVEALKGTSRVRKIAWARHVIAYLLYAELGRSSQEKIAGLMSTTIPSVKHSIRVVSIGMMRVGGEVKDAIEKLRVYCVQ